MVAIAEKRIQRRYMLDDTFTIHHKGALCRVVDISVTGLGISYIGGEDWAEQITLEYALASESARKGQVRCRTVWESTMDFYRTRGEEKIRRRGLQFIEPASGDAEQLRIHLQRMAEAD